MNTGGIMVHAVATVRRWGNSLGIIIPKQTARKLSLEEGEAVDIDILPKKRIDAFGMFKGARPFEEEKEPHEKFW